MCWMMVIRMRFILIIMTEEALRCCTFCSKHLHREKCLTNIYILNPTSVQHKTSFGGYFDVIIITTKNDPVGSLQRKDLKQIDLENWQPEACRLTIQPWGGWRRRGWMQRRDCLRNTIWLGILGLKGKAWHLSKLFKTCIKSTQGNNVNAFLNLEYYYSASVIVVTD